MTNPFYHLAIPNQSPGALWNQATVGVTDAGKTVSAIWQLDRDRRHLRRRHDLPLLAIKATKSFSNGYTLLVGYNYHVQANQSFYDNVDNYLKNWTSLDSGTPRHRITAAGTWALPVGKGRKFLNGAPRVLDAVVGGWNLAGLMTYHSGTLLNFGGMLVTGDPHISNPGPNAWFDKSVFKQLPAFTRRTNPWYYSDIRGPQFINLDGTLNKDFSVTERIKFQLHMDAFNALNNMNYNNPNMSVTSSQFGRSTDIYPQDFGRRLQLGLRVEF